MSDQDKLDMDEYHKGLMEGRLLAQSQRLDSLEESRKEHGKRISNLEKASWLVLGAVAIIQLWPTIDRILGK